MAFGLLPCPGIVNSAAMNIGVHVSLWIMVLSWYMPRCGVAGSYGSSKSQSIHWIVSSIDRKRKVPKESSSTNAANVFCKFSSLPSPKALVSVYMSLYWGRVSLVAQMVKNLPAMQKTRVQSLGWEDSPRRGSATHSSILAWRIPMDRGAWRAPVHSVAKSQTQLKRQSTHARVWKGQEYLTLEQYDLELR